MNWKSNANENHKGKLKVNDVVTTASMAGYDAPMGFRKRIEASLEQEFNQSDNLTNLVNTALAGGAIDVEYELGTVIFTFNSYTATTTFADDTLENSNIVSEYEVFAYNPLGFEVGDDVEAGNYHYDVFVTLVDDEAIDSEFELTTSLDEVKRRVKVNAKGIKRIKMQCSKGFKWDGNACVKITGAELAVSRVAKRKALITKRSQGNALKIRTLRKSRKAKRFRKTMGLK